MLSKTREKKVRENFKPAGVLEFAKFCKEPPPFISNEAIPVLTKTQKLGLRYEKKAQDYLTRLCELDGGYDCVCNPWISFRRKGEPLSHVNYCQPDVLLVSRSSSRVIVGEIKLSHTGDSWRQLRQLYEPTLKFIWPKDVDIALLEICKWFDPHTPFPETFYYAENPIRAEPNKLGIHIFRSRRGS
jgi:hypothetical protein